MAKKSREKADSSKIASKADARPKLPFYVENEAVDPSLALLFASSAGPVKPPSKTRYDEAPASVRKASLPAVVDADLEDKDSIADENDAELSSLDGDPEDVDIAAAGDDVLAISISSEDNNISNNPLDSYNNAGSQSRKRKLTTDEDDLEGKYMLRIAKEEEKEEEALQAERRLKRQKLNSRQEPGKPGAGDETGEENESMREAVHPREGQNNGRLLDIPQHETLARDKDEVELEKSTRTVFLANVSILAITDKKAKKTLLEHMGSFLESLPVQQGKPKHKIESIRFRSTAYAGTSLPKKAAFAKRNLMEATTKGTNAYLVYSTAFAAREAVKKLNGSIVLDRHLRVDGVAHPAKIDHRRCVFVGNLGFVDDESLMDEGGENERKRSKIPSDVEEGLWRQFSKAGMVESVRVVRDEKTRVGKGFAYVQFQNANPVEEALLFDGKKYPPMLPRVLRVTRAKAVKKTALAAQHARLPGHPMQKGPKTSSGDRIYNPKISAEQQSLQGRAAKLLGKGGAARFKTFGDSKSRNGPTDKNLEGIARTPESIVFEGYRASANSGRPRDLKLGGNGGGKKKGKPRTRSSKRASEWKKSGRKTSK